jgi:hypothetical protein
LEAEVTLEYDNAKVAKAIANAISPDNFKTPRGLSIRTIREGKEVITQIKYQGKLPTFTATIDDLLFCASTAEKALKTAKKLNENILNR